MTPPQIGWDLFQGEYMAGTREGGLKAAIKNKAKDPDFYAKIGAKGGRNGHTGGFASTMCDCGAYEDYHLIARCAGKKGGSISRRPRRKLASV